MSTSSFAAWVRADNDQVSVGAKRVGSSSSPLCCLDITADGHRLTIHNQNVSTLHHLGHAILAACQEQIEADGRRELGAHRAEAVAMPDLPKSDPDYEPRAKAIREALPQHMHIASGDGTDRCAGCGLDLRDDIHFSEPYLPAVAQISKEVWHYCQDPGGSVAACGMGCPGTLSRPHFATENVPDVDCPDCGKMLAQSMDTGTAVGDRL